MNSKLFILVVVALSAVSAQLIAKRAVGVAGIAPAWGGYAGRVGWGGLGLGNGLYGGYGGLYGAGLYGGYGRGLYGGYGAGLYGGRGLYAGGLYGGYGAGLYGAGLYGAGLGVARVAAPAIAGVGIAAPAVAGLGVARVAGLGLGLGLRAGVHAAQHLGPVSAAIETVRTAQVVDVPTSQDVITPTNLIVEPNVMPVNIEFRSQSSPVNVNQVHIPGRPGIVQETQSEDEIDRLVHTVVKPVVQEVRETIVPFRRITQEVLPVQEEVHSLVARGERQQVLAAPQVVAQPAVAGVGVARVAAPVGVGIAAPVGVGIAAPVGVRVAAPVGVAGLGIARGVGIAAPVGIAGGYGLGGLGVVRNVGVAAVPAGIAVGGPAIVGNGLAGGLVSTNIARFGGALGGIGLTGGVIRGGVVPAVLPRA